MKSIMLAIQPQWVEKNTHRRKDNRSKKNSTERNTV